MYLYKEESNVSVIKGDEEEFDSLPSLKSDEEVKKEKKLKILTPNKLWTSLLVLLAQIKDRNNFKKLKNESDKYYIFSISIIKSSAKVYNNLIRLL